MQLNGFDRIAWAYDFLAGTVFGRAMERSQVTYLSEIQPGSRVLILGGGTGWIIARLLSIRPDCEVTYIDASGRMIGKARRRLIEPAKVRLIHGTEDDIPPGSTFDVVITHFYLDMFPKNHLAHLVGKIGGFIPGRTQWIATDFVGNEKFWQRIMLLVMYKFFHLTAGIQSNSLPDWNRSLREAGWVKSESRFFYSRFIESAVYRRNG